jgi:hypothetical protein
MYVYSVTVTLERELEDDWLSWMQAVHIPEVMETGCFDRFQMHCLMEPYAEEGHVTYNVHYYCRTLDHYQNYIEEEAPRLRRKTAERYGERLSAFRTLLRMVDPPNAAAS